MPTLNYGTERFQLDDDTARTVIKAFGAKLGSSNGVGWVTFLDNAGTTWSVMAMAGVPLFIDSQPDGGSTA